MLPARIVVPLLKKWTGWSAANWKNIKTTTSEKGDLKLLAEILFCFAMAQRRDTPITEYDKDTFMGDMTSHYEACGQRLPQVSLKACLLDEHLSGAYALLTVSGKARLSNEESHVTTIVHKASGITKDIPPGQAVDGKCEFKRNFRERETELASDASAIIVHKLFAGFEAWDFDEKTSVKRAVVAKARAAKTAEAEEREMLKEADSDSDENCDAIVPVSAKRKAGGRPRGGLLGAFRGSPAQKRRKLH